MTRGVAYDGAFVNDQTVAEAKVKGALAFNCYITRTTSCDPVMAHAHGLGSIATYERLPGELIGMSRDAGRNLASTVILPDLTAKGYPPHKNIAVYPSVDTVLGSNHIGACDEAAAGIADVLRPAGYSPREYGEGALLEHLWMSKLIDGPGWLSGSTSFPGWQAASTAPYVCMVQGVGSDVPSTDRNVVTNAEALGAYWPTGSPFLTAAPTPITAPVATAALEAGMPMFIVEVDRAECTAKRLTWPGCFLFDGMHLGPHIPTTNDVRAFERAGAQLLPVISVAQYTALGGK